jgi:hypothetical protein
MARVSGTAGVQQNLVHQIRHIQQGPHNRAAQQFTVGFPQFP